MGYNNIVSLDQDREKLIFFIRILNSYFSILIKGILCFEYPVDIQRYCVRNNDELRLIFYTRKINNMYRYLEAFGFLIIRTVLS